MTKLNMQQMPTILPSTIRPPEPLRLDHEGATPQMELEELKSAIRTNAELVDGLYDYLAMILTPAPPVGPKQELEVLGEMEPNSELAREIRYARIHIRNINQQLRDINLRIRL